MSTGSIFKVQDYSSLGGGAWVAGASDDASVPGIALQAVIGVTDPTDTIPALLLNGSKKNTTSEQAMGSLETVFQIETGAIGSGTKLMTILGSGKVGIGTISPSEALHVVGNIRSTGALYTADGSAASPSIRFFNSASGLYNVSDDLGFAAGGASRMYIKASSGDVAIGTTTTGGKLQVYQGAGQLPTLSGTNPTGGFVVKSDESTALTIGMGNSSIGYAGWLQVRNGTSAGSSYPLLLNPVGGSVGIGTTSPGDDPTIFSTVAPSGSLAIFAYRTGGTGGNEIARFASDDAGTKTTACSILSNGSTTCSSDRRLKVNINDVGSGLDIIGNLKPVTFNWQNSPNDRPLSGFIAQDVQQVLPNLVYNLDPETGYLSLDKQGMISYIVSAIQELDNKTSDIYDMESVEPGEVVSYQSEETMIRASAERTPVGVAVRNAVYQNGVIVPSQKIKVVYSGKTKVKVSEENGQIHAGDRLALSTQMPGYAAKQIASGQSIGTALADSNGGTEGTDEIMVTVNIAYQQVQVAQNSSGQLIAIDHDVDMGGFSMLNVKSIASLSGLWNISEDGVIVAVKVKAKVLETETGITIKDKTTGEMYCAFVDGGQFKTEAGACDAAPVENVASGDDGGGSGGGLIDPGTANADEGNGSGDEEIIIDGGSADLDPTGGEETPDPGSETPPADPGTGDSGSGETPTP
jgi:hypothetical protein